MKKVLESLTCWIVIVLAFICSPSKAQENIVFEEGKEIIKHYSETEIKGEEKYLYLKNGSHEFTISKMNLADIRSESTSDLIKMLNKENKEYFFGPSKDTIFFANNRIEMCYDVWSKKNKKRTIYFRAFNNDGSSIIEAKELFSVECKGQFDTYNSNYSVCYSPNKSKFAVLVENEIESLSNNTCTLILFNTKDYSIASQKELPVDYKGVKTRTKLESIDDSGNATVRFHTVEKKEKDDSGPSRIYSIQGYFGKIKAGDNSISEINEWALDKTKTRYSISEERTIDDKLIQAGMYRSKVESDQISDGTFYSVTDLKTGKLLQETYSPLATNILNKLNYTVTSASSKKSPGHKNFVTKQIVQLNGNCFVISQHEYGTINAKGSYFTINTELLISKYNSSGKNEWQVIIPKATYPGGSPNTSSGSYQLLIDKDKLHFIFLEHPKNTENFNLSNYNMDDYKSIGRSFGVNVICVTINEKGDATKSLLFTNSDHGFVFVPDNSSIKRDNKYLIRYNSVDQKKYGTITVK